MIQVTSNATGARHLIEGIAGRLRDVQPFLRDVERILQRSHARQFATKGREFGSAWAPRKDSLPHPLMDKTGRLKRSLSTRNADSVRTIRVDRIVYGTRVPYAKYHNRGTRNMPPRKVSGVSPRARAEIVAAARRHIGR